MVIKLLIFQDTGVERQGADEENYFFRVTEAIFVGWFTLEYLVRFIVSPYKVGLRCFIICCQVHPQKTCIEFPKKFFQVKKPFLYKFSSNSKMMQWLLDVMAICCDGKKERWQYDAMTIWRDGYMMRWTYKSLWCDGNIMRWQYHTMTIWHDCNMIWCVTFICDGNRKGKTKQRKASRPAVGLSKKLINTATLAKLISFNDKFCWKN